ncbi:MAG: type II toxin-antitoxin system mRNA interferase toxin, RelE/StbE family [Proteobacteria bacterium]|nr:MAG: type II toxin-antitoxin system mRNA interferase toxin, RelE/StbE family [Pseudomonadota bacterium]
MIYQIQTTQRFDKEFKKLDPYIQKMIKGWIEKHLTKCENPRNQGKALKANLDGKWHYRIGNYRLICHIEDEKMLILALSIGHRKNIY